MNRIRQNRFFFFAGGSRTQAVTPSARLSVVTMLALLALLLLLPACDPALLSGLRSVPAAPTATVVPATGASNPGSPDSSGTTAALATDTPAPIITPASSPTIVPTAPAASAAATSTAPASAAPPSAVVNAIKSVIQQANQEEVQAFASKRPSVMADTATASYYQQMVQSYNDMANSGITAVKLLNLSWGAITLQDANTAQANTTETWLTTLSDGSTLQETDPNVYTLVLQSGAWKIQDDQHPNTRTLQPQPGTPGVAPTSVTPNSTAPTPIASVVPAGTSVEQSSNWAGYTATGGTFTSISATWTVPKVSAGSGNTIAADATWVGIGGANTTDLIQAGTQATVQGGQVVYTAWWETLPQAAQTVPLDVSAGDKVSVSVTRQAGGTWQIVIRDTTSGQSFQKSLTYQSSLSSAEWIEESPTAGRRTLVPLDDFGTVTFTNATTVENGEKRSITQAGGQPVSMYSSPAQGRRGRGGRPSGQAGQPLAQPSALGADGSSFSVTRTSVPAPVVVP
jgi:hypothetical protein